jgi:predicted aspartyl protease
MLGISFRHDRRQIIIPIAILTPDEPGTSQRFHRSFGLIDTGASSSGISRRIAEELALPRRGKTVITTPAGEHVARLYRMGVGVYPGDAADDGAVAAHPYVLPFELIGIECSPGAAFDVLIGMDLIGRSELHVRSDGSGSITFAG